MEWVPVLEKIKTFGFTTLIPGHGLPQTDTSYLDTLIAALHDVNTQVANLAAKGMSLQETQSRVDFSSQAKSFGGTNPQFIEQMKSNWAPVVRCV